MTPPDPDRQTAGDGVRRNRANVIAVAVAAVLVLAMVLAWNASLLPGAPPMAGERVQDEVHRQLGVAWQCKGGSDKTREGDEWFICNDQESPQDLDFSACDVILREDGRIEIGMCYYSGGG